MGTCRPVIVGAHVRPIGNDEAVSEHALRIYTIGHSNHQSDHVVTLLEEHAIEAVVDVRSSPWSRFAPQFNRETLERTLSRRHIGYVFLGAELGGRPEGDDFYDGDGHVLYSEVAETDFFRTGVDQLVQLGRRHRVAMMCSEEDPNGDACGVRFGAAAVGRHPSLLTEPVRAAA